MKKTQKILALLTALLMLVSCFCFTVAAEETDITLVSAKQISENEYILEFSAPVRIKRNLNIFRRQSNGSGTDQQNPIATEYLADENATTATDPEGNTYSTHVKLTFDERTETFNRAKYGLVIAEYDHASGDDIGYISTKTIVGANGELVKSNRTNSEAIPIDFIWIPTVAGDKALAYDVHIENVYEDPIVLLAAEVSEVTADSVYFTLHFSAPVRIVSTTKGDHRVTYSWSPFSGSQSYNANTYEYVDPVIYKDVIDDFAEQEWSDTVKISYRYDTGWNNWLLGRLQRSDGGIQFKDDTGALNKAANAGFVSPNTISGINGRQVVANVTNTDGTEALWIPMVGDADASKGTTHISANTAEPYAVAGAPYAVSAVQHAGENKISVEFSEAVTVTGATLRPAVDSATTVALTPTSNGKIVEFAYEGELPAEFAEGYGIAYTSAVDATGIAAAPNYVNANGNLGWIPSNDAAYPVNIDVHTETKANYDDAEHWTECECGAVLGAKAPHDFSAAKDDENHWMECACEYVDEATVAAHDFSVANYDETNHWKECSCGEIDEATVTAHDFSIAKDDETHHWNECACGAIDEKIEHAYTKENKDSENHWNECACGKVDETTVEAHDFGDGDTCACGAKKYVAGDLNGDEEVKAEDAIYLLYHIFFNDNGEFPVNQPIDFNNDSQENATDAIYLLYHIFFNDNGEFPLFPVAE